MAHRYVVFGLVIESDLELPFQRPALAETPDLSIHCDEQPYAGKIGPVVFQDDTAEPRPPGSLQAAGCDDGILLRYRDEIDLHVTNRSITCHPSRRGVGVPEPWAVSLYVLGPGLSIFLERRGTPALHASAVAVEERALVFLSSSGGGKSTLAAWLVGAGMRLVADDIVAIAADDGRFVAQPAAPQMRLWPEDARLLLGDVAATLPLVHPRHTKRRMPVGPGGFGEFQTSGLPIGAVYLLERRAPGGPCLIEPLGAGQGVIELLRHSFAAPLVEKLDLQKTRLLLFARLAASIPLRRLSYPSGRENLDSVRAAILADLER